MILAVGECITEAHIRGLPVLREPSMYIHWWGCVGGAIVLVVVGNGMGWGRVLVLDGVCVGLSQWLVVV